MVVDGVEVCFKSKDLRGRLTELGVLRRLVLNSHS